MLIVVEGPNKVGKTRLAKMIAASWENNVQYIHHPKVANTPEVVWKELLEVHNNPDTLFIYDRWWLSDLVYAPHDNTESKFPLNAFYMEEAFGGLADAVGLRLLLLGSPEELLTRRGDDDDKLDVRHELMMYQLLASPKWRRVTPIEVTDDNFLNWWASIAQTWHNQHIALRWIPPIPPPENETEGAE